MGRVLSLGEAQRVATGVAVVVEVFSDGELIGLCVHTTLSRLSIPVVLIAC